MARSPRGWAALAAGVAALAGAWNPVVAPLALLVGIGAAIAGARALRAGVRRRLAVSGLVLGLGAIATALAVLALTAGVGRDEGAPILAEPPPGVVREALDGAAGASRPARGRAAGELESVDRTGRARPRH